VFHFNLRLLSFAPENKVVVHNSMTTPSLTYNEVIHPQKRLDSLQNDFIDQIKKSSVQIPLNSENLAAGSLELLAQGLRKGKIKESSIYGYTDEDNNFVVLVKYVANS